MFFTSCIFTTHDSETNVGKIQNILNIYGTNAFENGIGIQTAMFNHSCNSNAEAVWIEDSNSSTVRAKSNIKSGEEITINYISRDLPMKKHNQRQEILMSIFFFNCACESCKRGKYGDEYDQGFYFMSSLIILTFALIGAFGKSLDPSGRYLYL